MTGSTGIFAPKLQELGRIRTGDLTPGKTNMVGGKVGMRPRRLETFRLTSENKPRLHAVADLYGGEVVPWDNAPQGKQWQITTETNSLPVTVPPFATISQAWEQWSAGGCKIRCDGERITHADDPDLLGSHCICPTEPAERNTQANKGLACQPVTRLSLLMHEVPGIGIWRLDTRGFYAGSELMGIVPFLQQASAESRYLTCDLRLETRQVKRAGQTRIFPVVTLQPANVTLMQLLTRQIPDEALIATPQLPGVTHAGLIEESTETHTSDLFGDDLPSRQNDIEQNLDELQTQRKASQRSESDLKQTAPAGRHRVWDASTGEMVDEVSGEVIEADSPEQGQDETQKPPAVSPPTLEDNGRIMRLRADIETRLRAKNMTVRQVAYLVQQCGGGKTELSAMDDLEVLRAMYQRLEPDAGVKAQQGELIEEKGK